MTIFRSFKPGSLRDSASEAMQAIALVETGREQLRSRPGPFRDEGTQAFGVVPDFIVL